MGQVDQLQEAEQDVAQLQEERDRRERESRTEDLRKAPLTDLADRPHTLVTAALRQVRTMVNMRVGTLPDIHDLAVSIKESGLLHPPLVRATGDDDKPYELLAGRRRFAAMQLLDQAEGVREDWRFTVVTDISRREALTMQFAENFHQRKPEPVQFARAARAIMAEDESLTAADVSRMVGAPLAWTRQALRMLDLPESIVERVEQGGPVVHRRGNRAARDLARGRLPRRGGRPRRAARRGEDQRRLAEARRRVRAAEAQGLRRAVAPARRGALGRQAREGRRRGPARLGRGVAGPGGPHARARRGAARRRRARRGTRGAARARARGPRRLPPGTAARRARLARAARLAGHRRPRGRVRVRVRAAAAPAHPDPADARLGAAGRRPGPAARAAPPLTADAGPLRSAAARPRARPDGGCRACGTSGRGGARRSWG
ncbi:ParB/RepB/Spo0J family partition protein [Conexibacter sp. W3-3-2]|nr:ParB/RepB/Spo0J family partition protein [Conexibacter sp. W3-3-2]